MSGVAASRPPACTREGYQAARMMVAELGYPKGSTKWAMFWSGFRAAATGRGPDACPVPDITPAQRRAGKRTPHTRGAWFEGFAAGGGQ